MSLEDAQRLLDQATELIKQEKNDQAIETLSQINEESGELYAKAQYISAVLLVDQDNLELAIDFFKKVYLKHSIEYYSQAQFNLGVLYSDLKNTSEAIYYYKKVPLVEISEEIYIMAQFNLGDLYRKLGNFVEAEKAYKNINKENFTDHYAKAQLELGNLLVNKKQYDNAIAFFKESIDFGDKEVSSKAQFNLGTNYAKLKRFKLAESEYRKILRVNSEEVYARAQNSLGNILRIQGKTGEAEKAFKRVLLKYNSTQYANAQWNLFLLKDDKNYLKKIKLEYDIEIFAAANYILGMLACYLSYKNKYWMKIPVNSIVYKVNRYKITLTQKIVHLSSNKYQSTLYNILNKTNQILERVFVDFEYENSIAHYTNTTVSKLLLSCEYERNRNYIEKSALRLNTINLMNDPVEGELLHKHIGFIKGESFENIEQAFIACFTLHHDSLNQFRLYGKNKNQEASGLSLVLNKEFFTENHNPASIYALDNTSETLIKNNMVFNYDEIKDVVGDKKIFLEKSIKAQLGKKQLIKMPLYRCIYLDPRSGYIKVAQREEWSFCREDNTFPSKRWGDYLKEIIKIEESVRDYLDDLSGLIRALNQDNLNEKERKLLAEILLPLRYLIKHMAFKEEQECRMVYVTGMDNDLIQYDENINRVYIDYEPSVMQHLEKIYIAPKAKDEQTVFEYLCTQGKKFGVNTKGVEVKISQNPFR